MSQITVGKWGKNLAVRIPGEIVRAIGMKDGERVEIVTRDGDIVVRRTAARAEADALKAAEEIVAEAEARSLSDAEIRKFLDEGRRG
ncbi:MAG: AbrB/MazE/SpoVT family DNA-binding domain-containing protein [Propylenella sp.]